jgi:diacylglycerol O-acyltransferase
MDRMSGLDASFLYFESSRHLMHIGMVAIVDPRTMVGGYSFEKLKDALAEQLPAIPALLRKPRPVPLGLDHPIWVRDEDFDIDRHVHRTAVPRPGGMEEVAELAGHLSGIPLDRSRPLWEMWLAEGLADGRVAVVVKLHHSMVDGVASASVVAQLSGLPASAPTVRPDIDERNPSDAELVGRGLLSWLLKPVGLVRIVPNTVAGITHTVERFRTGTTMAAPFRAPRLPFNTTISGHRSVAFADLSLAEMKEVRAATGATVNDVLLTVCGGAMRRYLEERGQAPDSTLVASIPVSVRHTSARELGSNKVSILFARLGTHLEDPVERVRYVAAGTREAKQHAEGLGPDVLQDWAEVGSSQLVARALGLFSGAGGSDGGRAVHNVVISNIPGPQEPLTFLGARLKAVYPLGPVLSGAGLNITVMSHAGTLHVGLHACRELLPDLWDMARHLEPEMAELLTRSAGTARPPRRTPR